MSFGPQSAVAASRWGVIALAVAAGLIAAMQVGKVPPTLPLIAEELTRECFYRSAIVCAQNSLDAIDGKLDPAYVVNPEVL